MSSSLPSLAGRTAVVTGANTGIGRVTALELARAGARVVLACRSEARTQPIVDEIQRETASDRAEFLALDLSDLKATRAAAEELAGRGEPLHLLVNNAGLAGQRGITTDGFELAFGVNHLGHYLFTRLLLERLREGAPARIVNVSSGSHYQAKGIDWAALREPTRSLTGLDEYAVSKLANVLFSAELARRLAGTGVTTYSLHPGTVASDVWRSVPWGVRSIIKLFMLSNEQGAETTLYCAASPECAADSGLYYTRSRAKQPSRLARDAALARELWEKSAEWCDLPPE